MPKATSRDPESYARATRMARETREQAAREVAEKVAEQVYELIVSGDIMGGRSLVARRISDVLSAEQRGDTAALRAAAMDGAVAFGSWVAALDFTPPSDLAA